MLYEYIDATLIHLINVSHVCFLSFQKKAVGQHLMEQVFYKLDIVEKDYFGLQYTDAHNVPHWLDPTKPVKKQVKSKLHKLNINSFHKENRKCQIIIC